MPSKIRVLDEQTINQIAAGEVIENPASVVKELVENAIDAGSTEISIEIKAGGRHLIRVTDNGCGMCRDDALLSLERHATSKIRQLEDVYSLNTMGFRGEAIPSIASISRLTILTSEKEEKEGTLIIVEGGEIVSCSPAVRSPGTTIEVKSLFFNVPVRKKFQRSPSYDGIEILKAVSIQALAHPEIKFQLIHNQNYELSLLSQMHADFLRQLGERVSSVLGADFKAGLKEVFLNRENYHVQGFLGLPIYTRHNRTGQYLFINKRAVFSPFISYAIREGYGPALATNRYPVYVLHLTLPGSLVDVNVHPQKKEVRLHHEQILKTLLISAVEKSLQQREDKFSESAPSFVTSSSLTELKPSDVFTYSDLIFETRSTFSIDPMPIEVPSLPLSIPKEEALTAMPQIVACLHGYLLLNSDSNGLRLIDQQAAHRRILYEKLQREGRDPTQIQNLLIPETLETTPFEAAILREHLEHLNYLGIGIQEFGSCTFLIQAVPILWKEENICRLIQEIVDNLKKTEDSSTELDRAKWLAKAASSAAVSQKVKLTIQEGQALIGQLFRCTQPYLCPYGKPTMIEMSHEEIAKQFQRCIPK
jgi:DNA mismatch repair protein MutL